MRPAVLGLLFIALTVSGCNIYRINSEEVATAFYPSKKSASDVVYMEKIDQAYEIIGFVTVNTERSESMDEVLEKIKREAAILGGDAVTNITINSTEVWKKLPAQKVVKNAYVRANFTATVVTLK